MLEKHTSLAAAMEPSELRMLQRVFDDICERRGIAKNTDRAGQIASDLINLFSHGVRNERQLVTMLSGSRSYP